MFDEEESGSERERESEIEQGFIHVKKWNMPAVQSENMSHFGKGQCIRDVNFKGGSVFA